MQLETLRYGGGTWSAGFPQLDSARTLVLAFASPSLAGQGALAELVAAYPQSVVIGCSTSGEIAQTQVHDDSISAAIVRFDRVTLRFASAKLAPGVDSFAAGRAIATQLAGDDLRAVLVLSEGLHVNGSALVSGLNKHLPEHVIVTGGLAGDGARFARTWVLARGVCEEDSVVAVGLYGEALRIGHGSKGGWDTFGHERVVTRSEGNVLYTLDGRPALALYKEYLGERAAELPGSALLFPLALRGSTEDKNSVVRTVLSVDEATQSMTFAGDIPQGSYVKLMRANFDRLIMGAQDAALASAFADHEGPMLSIAISCVGRRLVLGARTEEETEATLDALPKGARQIGFYSYGEISPHTTGRCDLHNQTMTLTILGEA
jgi:hypothetical protein